MVFNMDMLKLPKIFKDMWQATKMRPFACDSCSYTTNNKYDLKRQGVNIFLFEISHC